MSLTDQGVGEGFKGAVSRDNFGSRFPAFSSSIAAGVGFIGKGDFLGGGIMVDDFELYIGAVSIVQSAEKEIQISKTPNTGIRTPICRDGEGQGQES